MSRTVEQVLKSGYLTEAEEFAIRFETVLSENDEIMGEQAAIAATCEFFRVAYEDHADILAELPDGLWWDCKGLPVKNA